MSRSLLVAVLLGVSLVAFPLAYVSLLRLMRSRNVPRPPWLPFFFIFGTVAGWILAAGLSPSGLAAMCIAFLMIAAPVALLASSTWLAVRPERTIFHRIAMWGGFGYVLAIGVLVICAVLFQ